jgi:hypothetical protein
MTGFVNVIYKYGYYELKIYQEKNKLINQPFKTFTTMKYAPSIAFEEMSGSAKGVTAAKAKGRKYLRNRGYGKKTTTASQSTVKGIFKQLSQSWKNLTTAQISAWNNLAQSQAGRSILGNAAKISGLNLYQRLNFWIIRCGGNAVANPPALVGVDAPAAATVQLNAEEFKFTLVSIPENVANLRLVIEASAPTSHGVSNAFDKASAFADPFSVVADTMDIKAAYDNKNGAPSAGRPKVFMRYFYVNAVTGEKSADILKEVELGATNDPFDEGQNGGGGD